MTLKPKQGWFLAFTAIFAVLAGFVFWGSWSMDRVPVMPDCPTAFPTDFITDWLRRWAQDGKFVPGDLTVFLGPPAFWVELKYVLATYCAALGMAYFLRGRGLARAAAYGAGLLLAFSGYWLTLFSAGHLGWFQWMTYGVFAFGLIDRALEKGRPRHWLLLGACLAWGSFYQPDLWLLFTVFTAVYFIFRWIVTARARKAFLPLRWVKGAGLSLAAFLLIGLPSFRSAIFADLAGRDQQIAEGQTLGTDSAADDARWEFVTNWSLPPEDTLEFFLSRIHGDTSCPFTLAIGEARGTDVARYTGRLGRPKAQEDDPKSTANYRQHSLYLGAVTCLLALVGLLTPFLNRRASAETPRPNSNTQTPKQPNNTSLLLFFSISAVVFYLFSLGRFCEPVYRLVYSLPMGDYLRAPVKWHHLTEFCVVVLAGLGIDGLWCLLHRIRPRVACVVCGLVVLVGAVDLAREAHRFCAPHQANCQLVPVAPDQLPMAKRSKGFRGVCGTIRQPLPNGRELRVPVVDSYPGPTPVRQKGDELSGFASVLAWLSALTTVAVLVFLLTALTNRRTLDKELK